jgi:lipopolysaccharide export system protein LptA
MDIAAQRTTYDGKAHTYRVEGEVRITIGNLVVTCKQATVYADPSEARIERVVFEGDVTARRGADSFRASRITYLVGERRLTAEGETRTRLKLPAPAGAVAGP